MHTLFISDLHLSPKHPDITASFIQFMREEAIKADALYVLGDLFDFWIGDDDPTTFAEQIKSEFRQLTQQGVPCYFTKGNRDFLVGKRFAQQTGVQLLPDEAVIDLYGQKPSYCMEIHSAPKIHATLNFEPKYISLGYSDYLDFFLLHLSKSLSAKYSQTYEMTNNISP